MKKLLSVVIVTLLLLLGLFGCTATASAEGPIALKALIIPKFEVGEMSGDFPGEAQYYYERYCKGGEVYNIPGVDYPLYVKDGVGLIIGGVGKDYVNSTVTTLLCNDQFDWSNTYFISTGCAGSVREYSVMGDVFVITATINYDYGHHADYRELADSNQIVTWYKDGEGSSQFNILNQDLMDKVYTLVKDIELETTERTRNYMAATFNNAKWALRNPKVQRGTTVTGDNYWKGVYDEANAIAMTAAYNCPDPYALTEMEDNSIAFALNQKGLLDHYIVIRDSVNMDVFMYGVTPESLWDPDYVEVSLSVEGNIESADIFATAMKNNFLVGSVVIDAILDGTF